VGQLTFSNYLIHLKGLIESKTQTYGGFLSNFEQKLITFMSNVEELKNHEIEGTERTLYDFMATPNV
jgi:hypothetical protein